MIECAAQNSVTGLRRGRFAASSSAVGERLVLLVGAPTMVFMWVGNTIAGAVSRLLRKADRRPATDGDMFDTNDD